MGGTVFKNFTLTDRLYGLYLEDLENNNKQSKFFSCLGKILINKGSIDVFAEDPDLFGLISQMIHPKPDCRPTLSYLFSQSNWLTKSHDI